MAISETTILVVLDVMKCHKALEQCIPPPRHILPVQPHGNQYE